MLLLNSLELRRCTRPFKLIGPTIQKAKQYRTNVDGSDITLKYPHYRTKRSYPKEENPSTHYTVEHTKLPNLAPRTPGWGSVILANQAWDFYGPLFTGRLGTLSMGLIVTAPDKIPPNVSFFHPRSFENTIADYLTFNYGDEVDHFGQTWLAPTDWKTISVGGVNGASFRAVTSLGTNYEDRYLFLPLSDQRLIMLRFKLSWGCLSTPEGNLFNAHDVSNMELLCQDIMNSLELKLSEKALAQQKTALQGLEDTSLIKDYPPLKWEAKQEMVSSDG